ncbi:MAG: hypothetical protein Q7U53_01385 [Anaerolineaceae bacterium]|nr:hypothetical protein [Anaerolineaceae bacterium]
MMRYFIRLFVDGIRGRHIPIVPISPFSHFPIHRLSPHHPSVGCVGDAPIMKLIEGLKNESEV